MSVHSHEFSETVELIFHNVEYLLTVAAVEGDTLCIEVERKDDGSRWRGDFTSRYIEDITGKTGNFKKYPVFVKMLLSAITEESESVFVDLLTYADLEMLKNRKGRAQTSVPRGNGGAGNNKRYLILTYAAEFDRVHYPLPLLFEENPEPAALQATIRRLRAEVDGLKRGGGGGGGVWASRDSEMAAAEAQADMRAARDQIKQLKQQVQWLEENHENAGAGGGAGGAGMLELHNLQQQVRAQEREIRHLRKEREMLAQRVEAREGELESVKAAHKRAMARKQRDFEAADGELVRRREAERELRIKVRDLTAELDRVQRSTARGGKASATRDAPGVYARGGGGYGGSSRGVSPSGSRGTSPSRSRVASQSPTRSRPPQRAPAPAPARSRTPPARSVSPARSNSSRGTASRRPSSAPQGRFDPTAYVAEQKRMREETNMRRGRTPPGSGRSTPTGSRPGSASSRRGGGAGRSPSPAGSRASSSSRRKGNGSSGLASPAWSEDEREVAHIARQQRATSPGRALQDVKARLTHYQNVKAGQAVGAARPPAKVGPGKQRTGSSAASPARRAAPAPKAVPVMSEDEEAEYGGAGGVGKRREPSAAYQDASSEIADIDSRLHALQSFLRQAKAA